MPGKKSSYIPQFCTVSDVLTRSRRRLCPSLRPWQMFRQPLPHPHPHPHPGSAYPYPPGPSGAWAYPTPLPPPPLPTISISFCKNPRRVYLPSILSLHLHLNHHDHHHLLLRLRLQSAIPTPYTVPSLQRPSQSHDFSGSTPPVPQQSYPNPHLSGTQPYSRTPLTTFIPFFPAAALSSASAGGTSSSSRKDKSKEAGPSSTVKDSVRSTDGEVRKECHHHHQQHQQQLHVQMQFSPLPVCTAENVDSASSTAPVRSNNIRGQQQQTDSPLLEKESVGVGIGKIDGDEESS